MRTDSIYTAYFKDGYVMISKGYIDSYIKFTSSVVFTGIKLTKITQNIAGIEVDVSDGFLEGINGINTEIKIAKGIRVDMYPTFEKEFIFETLQ